MHQLVLNTSFLAINGLIDLKVNNWNESIVKHFKFLYFEMKPKVMAKSHVNCILVNRLNHCLPPTKSPLPHRIVITPALVKLSFNSVFNKTSFIHQSIPIVIVRCQCVYDYLWYQRQVRQNQIGKERRQFRARFRRQVHVWWTWSRRFDQSCKCIVVLVWKQICW